MKKKSEKKLRLRFKVICIIFKLQLLNYNVTDVIAIFSQN